MIVIKTCMLYFQVTAIKLSQTFITFFRNCIILELKCDFMTISESKAITVFDRCDIVFRANFSLCVGEGRQAWVILIFYQYQILQYRCHIREICYLLYIGG